MKISKIIVLFLIVAAFIAGVYFSAQGGPASGWRDNLIRYFNSFTKQVQDLKTQDFGKIISEVEKKVFEPGPLSIGGSEKQIILLKSKIISETNLQRQQNGNLPALKENAKLDEAAAAKANDMFLRQYFEHVSPAGIDPGKLVQNYGYDYIAAGENLILGNFASEKEAVQDWMNSPGHRANILNNRYSEIGVAIIKGTYNKETVWIGVQEFGLPLATCSSPDENLKSQINLEKSQLEILLSQIDEKKNQIDGAVQNNPAYNKMIENYNQAVAQYNSLAEQIKQNIANFNNQVNIFNNCVAGN
ncbi:MAG: hypothetical protein A2528_01355 [Candidatus Staskawiczbacteria bacterium RIFOXYD2_FULL_37_9]|uniref:SCP domain-containing protein n=1 Tax=Candidatus Staskawiczbacteria bacterium RIFOXYB1_FULL_37_44 TaxID=1802223 RepID=A0A1G2IWN8_9BACT|nr:MAG: hypothetical protein A2358_01855 [Candidatus Staskawiczbacteria bacterium RIFOXYB1_FULL_37_44]OGZ83267.1 MAG: hypothetical protein A2416_00430 [Candidatus Staskawiczbacteria bacterium RIFOXYC1_FULL_37_52]OGZ87867.1 MAG: hypothetical protein A2444_03445 [Candidatus Staskawiczbacteria bacterium RIFOXYC2_FULL_37_19]OGZ89325.1 MAG: hypothetical protein A2581_00375 [Candidatus Staskawiczbacteria bacterium RIFOXYD1_FULL_37_110]OGZ94578.1 MAG: hypothetical protein A2528_01355 [Candidatus Stask